MWEQWSCRWPRPCTGWKPALKRLNDLINQTNFTTVNTSCICTAINTLQGSHQRWWDPWRLQPDKFYFFSRYNFSKWTSRPGRRPSPPRSPCCQWCKQWQTWTQTPPPQSEIGNDINIRASCCNCCWYRITYMLARIGVEVLIVTGSDNLLNYVVIVR